MPDVARRPTIGRLKRRVDFLRVAKGRRWHGDAFTLQAVARQAASRACDGEARFGFTLTKKVGCAVVRNRARRRLREAVRLCSGLPVQTGHDYVVIGRLPALDMSFDVLKTELTRAIQAIHAERAAPRKTRHHS